MITVSTLNEEMFDSYSTYLAGKPEARFGHDLEWAMALRDTYGVALQHRVALEDSNVVGVCPLFLCRPVFGGPHCTTSPFPSYFGPIYDSDQVLNALLQDIRRKTSDLEFTEIIAPAALPAADAGCLPYVQRLDYTYRLSLDAGMNDIFNGLSRDYRRILRKTEKLKGMELIVDAKGDLLDPFYQLYVGVYGNKHGFIPHVKELFKNIFARYPGGAARIYLAKIDGRYRGGVFTFWTHGEVYYAWSAVLPDRVHHPTHFLIWKIVQDAAAQGYNWFNMGESARDHEGLNHFKQGWGAEVSEPCRYFIPGRIGSPTVRLFDRISWARKVISRLPAGVITNFLSPAIRYFL